MVESPDADRTEDIRSIDFSKPFRDMVTGWWLQLVNFTPETEGWLPPRYC